MLVIVPKQFFWRQGKMFNAIRVALFVVTVISFFMVGVFGAEQEKSLAIAAMALASLGLMLNFVFYNESLYAPGERNIHDLKSRLDCLKPFYSWLFSKKSMICIVGYLIFVALLNLVFGYSVVSPVLQSFLSIVSAPLFATLFLVILFPIERFAYFIHQKSSSR